MFLSLLTVNTGGAPDRPRPGREWLGNLYRVHQRLCMAFPSAVRKANDPAFLAPFQPDDFGAGSTPQVHVERGTTAGFLFRVDPTREGAAILVQSALEPDWRYAFHNASFLLAAPVQVKPFDARFSVGERLRFCLLANPTRKVDTKSGPDGQRRNGRRVPAPDERLLEWLSTRANPTFAIEETATTIETGFVYVNKSRGAAHGQRLRSARYDGVLRVAEPEGFRDVLCRGIGPAKAFGFGLLSVARCK